MNQLVRNVIAMQTSDVSHTKLDSGFSKSMSLTSAYLALAAASLIR